jgi:hypothetical protein
MWAAEMFRFVALKYSICGAKKFFCDPRRAGSANGGAI